MSQEILFSRFKIIREIGKGGFGTVYQAFDQRMERNVAIKKIPKDVHTAPRAIREAKTIALLSHPNIVTLHDFLETEDHFYLVMEQVKGIAFDKLFENRQLEWQQAVAATFQIANALENAHYNYVIHRDIKPANLVLTSDGWVKVLDFGIAKLLGNSPVSYKEGVIGTLSYISPEQAADDVVDERSDLFSLGVFCYEAMTGINPFGAETQKAVLFKIQNHTPIHPTELDSSIPEGVGNVVMKMLEKDPEDRFTSVAEMRYKMHRYAGHIEEQEVLKQLHLDADEEPDQRAVKKESRLRLEMVDSGTLSNSISAAMILGLILAAGQFASQSSIPGWAFILGVPISAISIKWPKIGILLFFFILASINFRFNPVLGLSALLFLAGYAYITRDKPSFAVLFPFLMPIVSNAGFGLSFPLAAGLVLGPVNALIAGIAGSIFTNFSDIFLNNNVAFTSINSPKLWHANLDTRALMSEIFSMFAGNSLLATQALLIGFSGFLVSAMRRFAPRLSSLLALAVLILLLYWYRIITMFFSANPMADYNAALKAWSSSLLLSVPVLLIWSLINYFNYQKEVRIINGTTKRLRKPA